MNKKKKVIVEEIKVDPCRANFDLLLESIQREQLVAAATLLTVTNLMPEGIVRQDLIRFRRQVQVPLPRKMKDKDLLLSRQKQIQAVIAYCSCLLGPSDPNTEVSNSSVPTSPNAISGGARAGEIELLETERIAQMREKNI